MLNGHRTTLSAKCHMELRGDVGENVEAEGRARTHWMLPMQTRIDTDTCDSKQQQRYDISDGSPGVREHGLWQMAQRSDDAIGYPQTPR
jgi:hypothetical protein